MILILMVLMILILAIFIIIDDIDDLQRWEQSRCQSYRSATHPRRRRLTLSYPRVTLHHLMIIMVIMVVMIMRNGYKIGGGDDRLEILFIFLSLKPKTNSYKNLYRWIWQLKDPTARWPGLCHISILKAAYPTHLPLDLWQLGNMPCVALELELSKKNCKNCECCPLSFFIVLKHNKFFNGHKSLRLSVTKELKIKVLWCPPHPPGGDWIQIRQLLSLTLDLSSKDVWK